MNIILRLNMAAVRGETALTLARSREIAAVSLEQLRIIPVCEVGTVGVGMHQIHEHPPLPRLPFNIVQHVYK